MGSKSGLGAMLVAGFLPSTTLAKLPCWTSVHEPFRSRNKAAYMKFFLSPLVCFSLATQTVSPYCEQSSNPLLPSCPKPPTETDRLLPPSSFSLCPFQHNSHLKRTLSRVFPHPHPVADSSDSQGCSSLAKLLSCIINLVSVLCSRSPRS